MYTLERMKKWKTVWGSMTSGFFCLSGWQFLRGGGQLIVEGYTNELLSSIVMVAAFFAAIISLLICLTIRALEKDMEEQLKFLKNK